MRVRHAAAILLAGYLGLYNGYLALWNYTDNNPDHIFPYRAETYSDADKHALEQGIPYRTRAELTRLLEDYLS